MTAYPAVQANLDEATRKFIEGVPLTTAEQELLRNRLSVEQFVNVNPALFQGNITALNASIPAAGTAGRWYFSTVAGTLMDADAGSAVVSINGYLIDNGSAWVAVAANQVMDATTFNRILEQDNTRFSPTARNIFDVAKATIHSAINNAGAVVSLTGYRASDFMPVTPGGTIIAPVAFFGNASYGTAFYDWRRNFISFVSSFPANTPLSVPATASYVRCTTDPNVLSGSYALFQGSTVPATYPGPVVADALSTRYDVTTMIQERIPTVNLFNRRNVTAGFLLSSAGAETANAAFSISNYMPVRAGTTIRLSHAPLTGPSEGIVYYNAALARIGAKAGPLAANTAYTVPQLAAYARFSLSNTLLADTVVCEGALPVGYRGFGGPAWDLKKWMGLNLGVVGDSITFNAGWVENVNRYLQTNLALRSATSGCGMGFKILAASAGAGYVLAADLASIDLCVIALGTNDWSNNRPLGAFNDAVSPHQTDAAVWNGPGTFYGDVRAIIEGYQAAKPTLRLAFTTPLPRTLGALAGGSGSGSTAVNASGHTLGRFAQAIREVCAQFAIPCLDLNASSGLNIHNMAGFTNSSDGVHPNAAGAAFYSNQVGRFLETL